MTWTLVLLLLCCCLCQCDGRQSHETGNANDVSGGSCRYISYPGTAKVTGIIPEPGHEIDSSSELMVHFDIARDDSRRAGLSPTFERSPDYRIRVTKDEVRDKKITEGAVYPVMVSERTSGTCVPYTFQIVW
jgi:hypothetical protein